MKLRQLAREAFTLLEVMIAMAIFFVAMFSVLNLMSRGLGMARALQQDIPSAGMIAAELYQLAQTNRLEDGGTDTGDFEFLAPEVYPGYEWSYLTYEAASNGLFQADLVVEGSRSGNLIERKMSIFIFSPRSSRGGLPGTPVN